MSARRIVVALGMVVLGACGGDDPAVSDAARDALAPRVTEIRSLAESGEPDSASAKLQELRTAVEDLRAAGELSEEGAGSVLEAAALVETQLALITTTTTQAPPPDDEDEDEDEDDDEDDDEDEDDRDRPGRGQGKPDDD